MLRHMVTICLLCALAWGGAATVRADDIENAIENGLAWLVAQQNPDGSWYEPRTGDYVSPTAYAVLKLEERAWELGFDSPFDPNFAHAQAVENGLAYLFQSAHVQAIGAQPAGNPDANGNGLGVSFYGNPNRAMYDQGMTMMALAASRSPGRVVDTSSPVMGWTYAQVMQDAVDFVAWAQTDGGAGRGGWRYTPNYSNSDNSVSGYVVMGLVFAEDPRYGFGSIIAPFVRTELEYWINYIQTTGGSNDGGSGYTAPNQIVNILKTGNLILEMYFVGDSTSLPSARMQRALDYIGRVWHLPGNTSSPGWQGNPPWYEAMYCAMQGLRYAGITLINDGTTDHDWYDEFATAIVNSQYADGSWPIAGYGGLTIDTTWALLTLEAYQASGACCYDDGTCDELTVQDCLWAETTGPRWLGPRTTCDQCCTVVIPPDATLEDEPLCGDNYNDMYNGGCATGVSTCLPIDCDETVAGESGTFRYNVGCIGDTNCDSQISFGDINGFVEALVNYTYCDGTGYNADITHDYPIHAGFEDINPFVALLLDNMDDLPLPCPGPLDPPIETWRDIDCYEYVVTQPTVLTITIELEFDGGFELYDAGSGDCATHSKIGEAFTGPCQPTALVTDCLPPGTYWIWVMPTLGTQVQPGMDYELSLQCAPCP